MAAPIAGFTGVPFYGEVPLEVRFTDLSTGLPTSWLWTFGDGETGSDQNPSHTYSDVGNYVVRLDAFNGDGSGSATGAVTTYKEVSLSVSPSVVLVSPSIKYCGSLTCMGWIKDPAFGKSGKSLILLAVSDMDGEVRGSSSSMYFELFEDDDDHRLAFLGSKSMAIKKTTGIDVADGFWHMLTWVVNDSGIVTHYVDGVECPAEAGNGPDGVEWSRPHTTAPRIGGGYVWVPCLDQSGQSLVIYNWRYAGGLVVHSRWVNELMAVDKSSLGV